MLISEKIQKFCRDRDIKHSKNREIVADVLQEMKGRATAEQIWIHLYLTGPRLSSGCVYLCLKWLMKSGFVQKHRSDKREALYFIRE